MEWLNKNEYKMINQYKRFKDENIALYFFNKFRDDLLNITYSKIRNKFNFIPYEKGDLVHIIWNAVKITLQQYKKEQNFKVVLLRNCYLTTIKEIRKFINNGELVMNLSGSFDKYIEKHMWNLSQSSVSNVQLPRKTLLNNLIDDACEYVTTYSQPTIKRVIYFKSLGYSTTEICKKLRLSRHHIDSLLKSIQKMIEKYYLN